MSAAPPSQALARLALATAVEAGVRAAVLCPGSRSAPLAYALAASPLPLHVRVDERAAAFTALGIGRAGRGPGLVATTSGTAVANLHPAVLEAHEANVPLVVVTADRPPALRGTWANQTTALQAPLFGAAVRARLDLDDVTAAGDPAAAAAALAEVLAASRGNGNGDGTSRPGPVHVNLGFSEPLVPDDGGEEAPGDASGGVRWGAAPPAAGVASGHDPGPTGAAYPVPVVLPTGPRTVVVAGDGAGQAAARLAVAARWPLLAEPSSGAGGAAAATVAVPAGRLVLGVPRLRDAVQRVVVFGRATLSRPVTRLLADPGVELVVVSPYPDWPDPGRPATRHAAVTAAPEPDGGWLTAWLEAGAAAAAARDAVLAREPGHVTPGVVGASLSGPVVAREVVAAARAAGDALVVAASNAVRDVDLVAAPTTLPDLVVANRGLAGIDGTVSTAGGLALGLGRRRVRVLVGDLAFLHDANGLLVGPGEERPSSQVVVLDDGGGGIFSLLEHGEVAARGDSERARFERLFGTPHGADVAALCRGYGVECRRVMSLRQLRVALADPVPGTGVVHVPVDRTRLRDLHRRIAEAVSAATAV